MASVDQKETPSNTVEKTSEEISNSNNEKIETKLDSDPSQQNAVNKGLSNTNSGGGPSQQKKEQTSNSQRKRRGGNGSRSNRGRRQAGKKGEWKKLDVEVSFNKNNQSGSGRRGNRVQPDNRKNNNLNSSSSKGNNLHSHHNQQQHRRKHGGAGGRSGFNNRSNNDTPDTNFNWRERKDKKQNKSNYNSNGGPVYSFPKLTAEQLESATKQAVKQVEFFFSNDELCRNTYLRNHMDVQGYLPAAIVFNFPSVVMYSVPYDVLLKAIGSSQILELDLVNETVRLKENYEKWLYPNDEGGFGCPRWIKQPSPPESTVAECGDSAEQNNTVSSKALQKETAGAEMNEKNENISESTKNDNPSSQREIELNESAGEKVNANKQNDANTPDLCETDGESRDSM